MLLFANTRRFIHTAIVTLAAISAAPNSLSAQTNTPGDTAQLFMHGTVSTELPEFAAAMAPGGNIFLFNRANADRSKIYLLQMEKRGGVWQTPRIAPFSDSTFREIDPFITPDGQRVLFSTQRPLQDAPPKDFDVWMSERKNGQWKKPAPLDSAVNSAEDEVFVSSARNGNLYFARFKGAKSSIFRSIYRNGRYEKAEKLILGTDTASIANPAIAPDESALVFWSTQMGGQGSADLFVCYRQPDGSWSKPQALPPPFNSAYGDFAPAFSPDGKTLFFTSERPGVVRGFPKGKRRPGDVYALPFKAARLSDKQAVQSILRQYRRGWLDGDAQQVLSLFAPDARITPNGGRGIDSLSNIGAFWFPDDGSQTTIHQFDQKILSVDIEGDVAFVAQKTLLDWSYKKGQTQMGQIQTGYAHTILKRQPYGDWKIIRQSWSDVTARPRP